MARGLAIIAIVLGHVIGGVAHAGIAPEIDTADNLLIRVLYAFHLSVFALLSGLFVRRTVERDGVARYLRRREGTFIYVYLLWTVLQGGLKLVTGSLVNNPISLQDMLAVWKPDGQLWFVPFIILMTTVAAITRFWRTTLRLAVLFSLSVVVSLTFWGVFGVYAGTQGLGLTAFFIVGVGWGAERFATASSSLSPRMALVSGLAGGTAFVLLMWLIPSTMPTVSDSTRTVLSVTIGVGASILGVLSVLALSRAISSTGRAVRWLEFVGERSFEIFLAHVVASAATRVLLSKVGVENAIVHIALGVVAGIVLPLALWWVCEKFRVRWVFGAPRLVTG